MADPSDVAETLIVSLSLLIRRLRQTRDATLSMPETAALGRLDHGGAATVTALAKLEQISAQSMGATLAGLESRGLIERSADPADGRQAFIAITRAGRQMLRSRRSARTRQLARLIQDEFTPREMELLAAAAPLLERLGHKL